MGMLQVGAEKPIGADAVVSAGADPDAVWQPMTPSHHSLQSTSFLDHLDVMLPPNGPPAPWDQSGVYSVPLLAAFYYWQENKTFKDGSVPCLW